MAIFILSDITNMNFLEIRNFRNTKIRMCSVISKQSSYQLLCTQTRIRYHDQYTSIQMQSIARVLSH